MRRTGRGFSTETGLSGFIERAVDELPDGLREVFVLRDVQGLATADVAASLDLSEPEVQTRRMRARTAIHRALAHRTIGAAPELFRLYRPRCDRVVARVLAQITTSTT